MTEVAAAGSPLRNAGARIAVSGASGFIGRVLTAELTRQGFTVLAVSRSDLDKMRAGTYDTGSLEGSAAAIHLAGRAHVLRETEADPSAAFRVSNRDATVAFANACAKAAVGRFVFVSSIGVNGSASVRPFRPDDAPGPDEPYAVSKLEAEQALWATASENGLQVVVVRPPLVYGPEAKGNFLRLLKLASLPVPLPLGRVRSRRSFVSVWNLADLLIRCVQHPAAAGRTFLAGDGEDIDLPDLLRSLASAMGGRRIVLLSVPVTLLRLGSGALGKGSVFEKLSASLQVDISQTRRLLDWTPPLALREGLERTARWFVETSRHRPGARPLYETTKRVLDVVIALLALAVLAVPMLAIALSVKLSSRGPVLYWSDRIGRGNAIFSMPKFRSMYTGTPAVATHLLAQPAAYITPLGQFLRKSSLDELPQLWSVLAGDMSLVGPRPALFNQDDLIEARTTAGVHELRPGITGWAQVNGRDELPIPEKVALDAAYLRNRSFLLDLRILFLTAWKVVKRDGVAH